MSNCLSFGFAEISEAGCESWRTAMTSQTDTRRSVIPYAPKGQNTNSEADQLDRAGGAILGLINQAADTTEADLQVAREAAEKLADQLRAAQSRINQLGQMLDTIKTGRIAPRNGCIKFRRRSSKDFLERTIVAPLVGAHRDNTEIGSGHLGDQRPSFSRKMGREGLRRTSRSCLS